MSLLLTPKPKKINIYNLKYFFNYKSVSPSAIIPGSLIEFSYRSPEGIHDKKPLVVVLSVEGDRCWGLNLHYKFQLIEGLIANKFQDINTYIQTNPNKQEETLREKVEEIKQQKKLEYLNSPKPTLLESFSLKQEPTTILRNYLYTRMSGIQKLSYKL